jgi:hypothetical protein
MRLPHMGHLTSVRGRGGAVLLLTRLEAGNDKELALGPFDMAPATTAKEV